MHDTDQVRGSPTDLTKARGTGGFCNTSLKPLSYSYSYKYILLLLLLLCGDYINEWLFLCVVIGDLVIYSRLLVT